jgi:pimeloyl-ACP methyl ester carboxylesterase
MPFYQNNGVRLHYVSRCVPSQTVRESIVFQHGIGGDVRQPGRFLIPERTGIRAEALNIFHADFRGHGQSELGPVDDLSIATLAGDLAAFLDHLGLQHAIVGGISLGAAVALRLAVEHPHRCRALIISRPAWTVGPVNTQAQRAYTLVADLLAADDWQSFAMLLCEQYRATHQRCISPLFKAQRDHRIDLGCRAVTQAGAKSTLCPLGRGNRPITTSGPLELLRFRRRVQSD